jgi:glutamate N-acetyltransferase / amino-acid N-acetyltransferase
MRKQASIKCLYIHDGEVIMMNTVTKETKRYKMLENGHICSPKGYSAGGMHCGIKRKRNDLGWVLSEVPANVAAVYTTNQFQAAPLIVTKESIAVEGKIQGIIVNSGNANSFTGSEGMEKAYQMRRMFAEQFKIPIHFTGICSTGVIGEQLDITKIQQGIEKMNRYASDNPVDDFEKAILTTDTFQKRVALEMEIDGKQIHLGGAAKGSGMIHPNMATMLGFITTDASVEKEALQLALKSAVDESFNMITVDGDSSTNDTVLLLANGMAGNHELKPDHPSWNQFTEGLKEICRLLAMQIARDGEGATKLVEVVVNGALTKEEACVIGKTIVGSSLVKAAIFGADANWGRIVNAIGYSGVKTSPASLTISIGPYVVMENGLSSFFSEEEAASYLKDNELIQIYVKMTEGSEGATAWGCDLSYDYVKINASYRT